MPMPIPTILGPKSGGLSIGMVLVKKVASTTSMETQTGQGEEEDFLLFAHNCTQTELERLFSPPAPSASTSETQTRLTGFQEPAAVANTFLNTEDMYSHIETQTCDLQDLLS